METKRGYRQAAGQRVTALRVRLGDFSAAQLAKAAGVSENTVSNAEHDGWLKLKHFAKIAIALAVDENQIDKNCESEWLSIDELTVLAKRKRCQAGDELAAASTLLVLQQLIRAVKTDLDTGQYDSALADLRAAIPQHGAPQSVRAELHLLRSEAHLRLNEYADAKSFAQRAIDYFAPAGNWPQVLKAHGILNTLYRDLGQYGRAVEVAHSMLDLAKEHSPGEVGVVHRKLARSLALNGQYRDALEAAENALRIARVGQNIDGQAKAHLAYGEAHRHGGIQAKAIEEYRMTISLACSCGDWDCFLWAALSLADSYLLLSDVHAAREILSQVERVITQPGRRFPLETLHHGFSVAVLNFVEGNADGAAFESFLLGYKNLNIPWPAKYVSKLRASRRAADPKRM